MKNFTTIFKDVLYVSRLTNTKNKKILIFFAVILSQITAGTDLLLIGVFASVIADQFTNIAYLNDLLNFMVLNKYLIIILIMFRYLTNYLQASTIKKIELDVLVNLRAYIFSKILKEKNYSRSDSYFYINTLCGHVSYFYSSFAQLMNHILQAIAYGTYLLISNSNLMIFFISGVIFLAIPIKKLIMISRQYMHKTFLYGKDSNEEIGRVVDNLFLIKILRMEKDELRRFTSTMDKIYKYTFKSYQISFINTQLPNFFTLFVFSIILNIERFITFLTLDFLGVTLRLFQSISVVSTSLNQVANSQVHISKFAELEKLTPKKNENYFSVSQKNKLEVKDVSFKYNNSNVYIFENLNINFQKNTHNLILGANGTGKSTLLGILGDVLIPQKGSINSFTDKYGYIGATPFVFNTTLRDNITYGNRSEVDDKLILNYLEELEMFKEKDSYDLNRIIDNNELSSGQMQKMAFVRSLLAKPEILLLDEAMANLDDESKKKILEILKKQNITLINSTHDPDRFENVDSIYKIDLIEEVKIINKII